MQAGQPPLAMILADPNHKEWTRLDYQLAKAYELRQTYGDIPPWIDRSDRVTFDAKAYTSNSAAALERKQEQDEKSKRRNYGRKYYLEPRTKDGGPMPTMEEYYEEQRRKRGEA